jgi:hypothetical protein
MTVCRTVDEFLKVNRTAAAQAVRRVLESNPRYRNTAEMAQDSRFATNIKPSWWLLGTNMSVSLADCDTGTMVTVQTRSQPYIMGDIFCCYDRYIRHFLEKVKSEAGLSGRNDQAQVG